MLVSIAHSVRGRLRARLPATWLGPRREAVEAELRGITGVRAVQGRPLTGSVCVDYDPFLLAEQRIIDALDRMTRTLDASPEADRRPARTPDRQPPSQGSLLKAIGATSVLAATTVLPTPPAVAAGLVLAASLPTLWRAGLTLARRPRLNGDVLDASTLALLTLRGHLGAAALLTWLRSVGEYIVARSVVSPRPFATRTRKRSYVDWIAFATRAR